MTERWWRRAACSCGFVVFALTAACGLSIVGTGGDAPAEQTGEGGAMKQPDGSSLAEGAVASPDGGAESGSGDAGNTSDAQVDASVPIPRDDAGCPTGRGPTMLRLFGDAGSPAALCIDVTEVSSRQYIPFIADFDAGRAPMQSADCAANTAVYPLDMMTNTSPPLAADDPVDRIDQCDAQLFCAWAGKHLCGRRDGTDTYIASTDANDHTIGEWYAACSQDGASSSVPATCNLQSNNISGRNADGQVDITAAPPGGPTYPVGVLRHIVGNVEEWADGCDGTGSCVARGASEQSTGTTDCTTRTAHPRMDRRADLGFRCCAKPLP
jgi:formylglycine-generating enzyme required for sulfatase activity